MTDELTSEYNRLELVRQLLASFLNEFTDEAPAYVDFDVELSSSEVDAVATDITNRIEAGADATLSIITLPRYLDLKNQQKILVDIDLILGNPRIAIGVIARECLQIEDYGTALLSGETLHVISALGHFLLLKCWLDDFGSANWDDPGENPFVQLDNHWIRVLPRASGGSCEICACGFDFADPDKRELDPEYLQDLDDRAADPVGFALKQVLAHQFEEFAEYADLKSQLDSVPPGHLVHPNTVLEYSQTAFYELLKEYVDSVIPSFLEQFSRETSKREPDFNGSFSSIEEIEGSFEYAPSAYECLAAKIFLQLSSTEKLDVSTRRVCSELGHSLLWHVDSLADSGFGYGVEVVEPEEHQPNLDAPGCKCGFPNIDFTD